MKQLTLWLVLLTAFSQSQVFGIEKIKPPLELQEIQELIGQWKGVGQLKRGSTQGGWIEESHWEWKFGKQNSALVYKSPKGKFVKELKVSFEDDAYVAQGLNGSLLYTSPSPRDRG